MSEPIHTRALADGDVFVAMNDTVAWADELQFAYAWVSSQCGKGEHWLELWRYRKKITKAVVGTSFDNTEPFALEKLNELDDVLRVFNDPSVITFHPKILLATQGEEARAIVGSSNFTRGGFHNNKEFNLQISGARSDPAFKQVAGYINDIWDRQSSRIDEAWLSEYKIRHARRPAPRPRCPPTRRPHQLPAGVAPATRSDFLGMDWDGYLAEVMRQDGRLLSDATRLRVLDRDDGDSYLQEIDLCQEAYHRAGSFGAMTTEERKQVCGIDPPSTGFLGRMNRAKDFHTLIINDPTAIAPKIDAIPPTGPIPLADALRYLEDLCQTAGVAMGAATRLMATKRPDLFVPVNGGNLIRRKTFGMGTASTPNAYMALVEKTWDSPWHRSPQPNGIDEARIWAYRAAMLDTILYEAEAANQTTASKMFRAAFPGEYEPRRAYNRVSFQHGATIYINPHCITIIQNDIRNFPHSAALQTFIQEGDYPVDGRSSPGHEIPLERSGDLISILEGRA